jgi:purine catabolism regulator
MLPTVGDLLGLDVVRRGSPQVVAGSSGLGARVRWVHVLELADVAHLLQGGEFVLTTGIALPAEPALLARYAADLAAAGVSALAVELGRRYVGALPSALVRAAADSGLTLIAFEREVPFVEITEAVHARIIDAQLEELRASERLHEVFTELSVAGATPDEVVRQAAALAGRPVILADLAHRVLACEPGSADPTRLLADFARRSRAVSGPEQPGRPGRTVYDEASGWLLTPVGARGEDWGRVILVCDGPPTGTDTVLVERAATTLALGRLLTRHRESLDRQAHRTLITSIITQAHADPAEAAVRSRALGVPVDDRQLIAVVFRLSDPLGPLGALGVSAHARVLDVADITAAACRTERVPALVGTLDDARAGAMLSLSPQADQDRVLTSLATLVRERLGDDQDGLVIGVGAAAGSIKDVRRSFLEASQVADVAAGRLDGRGRENPPARPGEPAARPLFYRLPDLRLRGLLHLLRDDPRLQTFVERELGALLARDQDTDLIGVLTAYLAAGGNKAAAAKNSHLARPTFYQRLHRIERILGTDLSSAESRTSLHVALLALEAARAGLQAFVQRFPGEFERERADGVDGVEVTAADREPFPGVLAVRGKQEPFHGDRGAVVVGHADDPVVRDAGGGVLRALVPDVGGDGVGRYDLQCDQAIGGDRLASPSPPVVVDAPVDDHVGTAEVQFRTVGDQDVHVAEHSVAALLGPVPKPGSFPDRDEEVQLDRLMAWLGRLTPDDPAIDDLDQLAGVFRECQVHVKSHLRRVRRRLVIAEVER